jgi:hypothetical protein
MIPFGEESQLWIKVFTGVPKECNVAVAYGLILKGPQDYRDLMHIKFELHFEGVLRKIYKIFLKSNRCI